MKLVSGEVTWWGAVHIFGEITDITNISNVIDIVHTAPPQALPNPSSHFLKVCSCGCFYHWSQILRAYIIAILQPLHSFSSHFIRFLLLDRGTSYYIEKRNKRKENYLLRALISNKQLLGCHITIFSLHFSFCTCNISLLEKIIGMILINWTIWRLGMNEALRKVERIITTSVYTPEINSCVERKQ